MPWDRTQNANQLQQQLFHATEVRVTTQTVRNHLYVAQLRACCPCIVLLLNANHPQAYGVDSIRSGLDHNGLMLCSQPVEICSWVSLQVAKGLVLTGECYQPPAMIAHDYYGWGSVIICGGITLIWEDRSLQGGQDTTSIMGMSLYSYTTETMLLSLLLCPMPVSVGMHSSFKTTMQELIVQMLSKITCSFAESWLSHGQLSPQTCL